MWWFIISQFSKSYKTSPFRVVPFFLDNSSLEKSFIYSLNPTNPLFLSEYLGVWIHKPMGGIVKWEFPKWIVWGFKTPMKLFRKTSIFRFSATNRGLVFIKGFFTCLSLGNHSMDRRHRWDHRWPLRRDRRALPVFAVEDVAWRGHHPGDADGAS